MGGPLLVRGACGSGPLPPPALNPTLIQTLQPLHRMMHRACSQSTRSISTFEAIVLLESGGEDLGDGGRDVVVGEVEMTHGLVEPSTAATYSHGAVV